MRKLIQGQWGDDGWRRVSEMVEIARRMGVRMELQIMDKKKPESWCLVDRIQIANFFNCDPALLDEVVQHKLTLDAQARVYEQRFPAHC